MFYWIYELPNERLAAMFVAAFVGFSWAGAVLARPLLRRLVRTTQNANDIVGYVLSCFCVFYGLLLALLSVAAYENYAQVESAVAREAAVLAALYQDASAYPEPHGENLRWRLRDYCRYQIKYGWPLQKKGIVPEGGATRLTAVQEALVNFQPATKSEEILHAEALRQFNHLVEHRQVRLNAVTSGIPAVMWYVVVLGAAINIGLVWLFDMKLVSHLFLGGLLAFFLGTVVFLLAAMDNPFRGEVCISPEPFEHVYKTMRD
jgi:hypothetical protein